MQPRGMLACDQGGSLSRHASAGAKACAKRGREVLLILARDQSILLC